MYTEKDSIFNKRYWSKWTATLQESKYIQTYHHVQTQFQVTKDLNIKLDTIH